MDVRSKDKDRDDEKSAKHKGIFFVCPGIADFIHKLYIFPEFLAAGL